MVTKAGGISLLYGDVISDAMLDPRSSLAQLTKLRDRARAELKAQGDLAGGIKKLEAEIRRRSK